MYLLSPRFLLLLGSALTCSAASIVTDLGSFVSQTGPNTIATFDDLASNTAAPFSDSGVQFSGFGPGVMNSLVGLGHSFWFGNAGSGPNFAGVTLAFTAVLPSPSTGAGFLYSGFASGIDNLTYTLLSASGSVVGSGPLTLDLNTTSGSGTGTPNFFGLISATPFQTVVINDPNGGGTFVIDDFRFASTASPQTTPEPTTAVTLLMGLSVVVAAYVRRI